jgi:hypothetical protein
MKHDTFCENQDIDFATSGCDSFCEYRRALINECEESGEHLRMTTIDPVHGDVCFNCGYIE